MVRLNEALGARGQPSQRGHFSFFMFLVQTEMSVFAPNIPKKVWVECVVTIPGK